MTMRVRFIKPCHAARRTWQPGEEADFSAALADEIAALGAAEIIGPGEPESATSLQEENPIPAPQPERRDRKPAKKRTPLP